MKNVIGVESCKCSGFNAVFIFSKLYAVMAGSGVLLMRGMRVHGPLHDTGEQHGGQSSQLDLLINNGGANQLETCKQKSRDS